MSFAWLLLLKRKNSNGCIQVSRRALEKEARLREIAARTWSGEGKKPRKKWAACQAEAADEAEDAELEESDNEDE